ncbi:50S ribosomal protein L11 methyltransferase [Spiribacter sp. 2438]|uniref:50S ribosomal protein L11 methyltransferase n=1 Tax=Spiribacter sp. 2438 TaxID=2666185 RepID=UPI0012AF73DE|nr:50S ribosomal protein L11 methyltransferase [Spiribacter sp. 2438]QGM22300.1 50S ribosomal protein L11 methyltransferase [Spiribacter sp. 2438]
MAWRQVAFELPAARAGLAEAALEAAGALSVTLGEPPEAEAVLEPGPGETRLWDRVQVQGLFETGTDLTAVQAAVAEALGEPPAGWQQIELADQAWERAWMADFGPMDFGHGLWVVPGDREPPAAATVKLRLDPGLAFGTGTHPTTALCLQALAARPPVGQTVIDYGCGSGVLAIAALRLGASRAVAVDNDPQALLATAENARRNGVTDRLEVMGVNDPLPRADGVIANILAGILVELAPSLRAALKPGGWIMLAGLLNHQAETVRAAYRADVDFLPETTHGDWTRLDGRRSAL